MPNYDTTDEKHEQAELIAEPRAEYKLTPNRRREIPPPPKGGGI